MKQPKATNDEDIRKAIDNYIFCTRNIVVGRHFAQIKSIHSAKINKTYVSE